MSYIFDASSIFRAVIENKIDRLVGGYTDILAKYELGNIIWKKYFLKHDISRDEYQAISKIVYKVLDLLKPLNPEGHENEVLDTAVKLGITYYDSVYVYHSKKLKLPLVTEDHKLIKKVGDYIKVVTLDELG